VTPGDDDVTEVGDDLLRACDVLVSAARAIERAGSRGLSAYEICNAVVDDGACGFVPYARRVRLGLQLGFELAAGGAAAVTPRNRFVAPRYFGHANN
jgi:hypothetical protein